MENYQMNRTCARPYQTTCGMNRPQAYGRMTQQRDYEENKCNGCHMPNTTSYNKDMLSHADFMTPAMAYVPCQKFTTSYDLDYALNVGTIFPQLCKPFCGKRGVCR